MTLPDETVEAEKIARIVWQANLGLQARDGEELPDPPWDVAPWFRKKALIFIVLQVLEGSITEPGEAHEYWCEYMMNKGWTFGEHKDYEFQRHPSLRPWSELSPRQQLAFRIALDIIREIAASENPATMQG